MIRVRAPRGPIWPYVLLVAIPAAAFVLPDLIGGHLLMSGDNVQQNYPLHVLVGSALSHGQLPFWDPYIFSGSPLLAGFNAGAFYPLIGLFVILPDRVAWISLEVILFSGIGIGMYIYLRALALSTFACLVAAVTFTCSGVVLSQVNHVDMTEGFVALPYMLLAVLHIVRDGRWRWSILLGLGLAVVILGGAPEAMLDEALAVLTYAIVSTLLHRPNMWRVVTRLGAGAALGLSLAAIQWLPGLNAIANSQRSGFGGGFAASGSYPTKDLLLSLVPYLYGGYHYLGEAAFFSPYNLPEIGIYVGILPLIAVLTLLRPSWPSRLSGRERMAWYVVGAVMLLFALGSNTPLEHVFNAIPLYGHQRLQSRNMIGVSAAICVLFAGWLDRRSEPARTKGAYEKLCAFIPGVIVLGLSIWALASPSTLITNLARTTPRGSYIHTVREASLVALLFCVSAGCVVLLRSRVRTSQWMAVVALFVAVDIGVIAGTSQLVSTPTNQVLSGTTAVEQAVGSHLTSGGRFDLFDPQGYTGSPYGTGGMTDYNILDSLPSVGGYASIVNGHYNTVTETHTGGDLNVSALTSGQLGELDLQEVITVPEYFMLPVDFTSATGNGVRQISEPSGIDPVLVSGYQTNYNDMDYPSYPPPRAAVSAGNSDSWFFGESTDPSSADLLLSPGATKAVIRFGKITSPHLTHWGTPVLVPAGARRVSGPLPKGNAIGLAMQVIFGTVPSHQATITDGHQPYELDGSLSGAVRPGHWEWSGTLNQFSFFTVAHVVPMVHAIGSPGGGPTIRVVSNDANSETVQLDAAAPVDVVRDVAWDSGWEAQVSADGHAPLPVHVNDFRLVQSVHLPAGHLTVTFRYRPPHLLIASVLSLGALAFLLLLLGWTAIQAWRPRPASPDSD